MTEDINKNRELDDVCFIQRLTVFLACGMVLFFSFAFFAGEKRTFSENENRVLAGTPEFALSSVRNGQFMKQTEAYISDHFPFRDGFLGIITEGERLSGRKEIEGVYLAKDGSLIESYAAQENTGKVITQFSRFSENLENAKCYLMIVPTAVTICRDRLPDYCPDLKAKGRHAGPAADHADPDGQGFDPEGQESYGQESVINEIYESVSGRIVTVDALGALKEYAGADADTEDRLYYRLDHHWTTSGAYAGYTAFCRAAGMAPSELTDYEVKTVSDDFRGTVYSKLNDPHFGYDRIVSCEHPDWKLKVEYADSGEVTDTMYAPEYLEKKDQYSYFLNNIHPLVTITNEALPDGAAAVVKDSYANSLIPFLAVHYHTIYVFDTRYYKGGVSGFINEHPEIGEVLILYNLGTMDNDTGIGGIY